MSLRGRLTLLLVIGALALILMTAAGVGSIVRLSGARDNLVDRWQLARVASLDLQVSLFEQQASMRGFVLGGGAESILADFDAAIAVELEAAALLLGASDTNPIVSERTQALETLAEEWRQTVALPAIEATRNGDRDGALAILASPVVEFEAVSSAGVSLGDALRARRQDSVDNMDRALSQLVVASVFALVMVVTLGIFTALALRREVLRPLDQLGDAARTVASGRFSHEVTESGPSEVRALARDIEAMRRQILDELQESQRAREEAEGIAVDLRRSNRDLEQFAYVASHDLQEPLRKVAGFCQLLERRYADQLDDRAREYIAYAVDGAQRMQTLINDLLMFSRVGRTTETFEPVDLNDIVAQVWADVGAGSDAGDEATLSVAGLPVVAGDPALLRTLFNNLISNAIKFRGEDPPFIMITTTEMEDGWEITVHDNGIGIDPQFEDRIFEIFQRLHTRDVYDGTGIGLAISKRIVEFHGGNIRLRPSSEASGAAAMTGACFVIGLPNVAPDMLLPDLPAHQSSHPFGETPS